MIRKFVPITLLLPFLLLLACGDDEPAATARSDTTEARRVEVEVTASGYSPSEVEAEAGQPLTLVFTRTSDEGCGRKVSIPSENITRDLPLNEPVAVTFTPREAGEIRFTCGMGMYDGKIVVR